jgi:hypothetical protein
MKSGVSLAFLIVLLLAGSISATEIGEACCACVAIVGGAEGEANGAPTQAFFCALLTNRTEQIAFDSRCGDFDGIGVCVAPLSATEAQDGLDCDLLLAEASNIACPAEPAHPVPLLGHGLLGGLGALLAGLGMWSAAHRRRGARS